MSFLVNNNGINSITFQGKQVETVYYNGFPVWGSDWDSWNGATWADIYSVCKAKQSGAINAWPADIQIGKTKSCTIRANDTDYECKMRIIGMDIDAPGTLTFEISHVLYIDNWTANKAYENMKVHADANPEGSPYHYIKQVSKEELNTRGDKWIASRYTWALSMAELGITANEYNPTPNSPYLYTAGVSVPYQYYEEDVPGRRIKLDSDGHTASYPTRDDNSRSSGGYQLVTTTGEFDIDQFSFNQDDKTFAFTIG